MFSMYYMCCPVLSRALESMGSVKESACPPQMMDLPWYFYKSTKGQNSHRVPALGPGQQDCKLQYDRESLEGSQIWKFASSCTPKRPEFGLAYSLGEEFRWLPEL